MKPKDKLKKYVRDYGLDAINLVIERTRLADDKRTIFAARWGSEDPEFEKECTQNMEKLSKEIYNKDNVLLVKYNIDKNLRTQIVRTIKKVYPNFEWLDGLKIEEN